MMQQIILFIKEDIITFNLINFLQKEFKNPVFAINDKNELLTKIKENDILILNNENTDLKLEDINIKFIYFITKEDVKINTDTKKYLATPIALDYLLMILRTYLTGSKKELIKEGFKLTLDFNEATVEHQNKIQKLTLIEGGILYKMLDSFPKGAEKQDLLENDFNSLNEDSGVLETHISNIRKKLKTFEDKLKINRKDNKYYLDIN